MRRVNVGWMSVAVAVVALAGCGSKGSSNATTQSSAATATTSSTSTSSAVDQTAVFKAKLTPVATQLGDTAKAIGRAIEQAPSRSDSQLGAQFSSLAGRLQQELSQLESLKPPASMTTDFNTVTDAVRRAEADLTSIVAAASTHDKSAAEQAGASLVTDLLAAKTAATKITSQLGIK